MAAGEQSNRMAPDMEARMKQSCVTEFLYAETVALTDIHWYLLNVDGDQTVDVSTVRWWVVLFVSGDDDEESPLLAKIFMIVACRLLFIARENA